MRKGKNSSIISQPKGSDCCSVFQPLDIHGLSSHYAAVVHGVMSKVVARLLNRVHHYSVVDLHGLSQARIEEKVMLFISLL